MKLNKKQRYALLIWLGSKMPELHKDHSVIASFDEFCDGEIPEWRIIYKFGMAGKIWNVLDKIYITGYSHGELSKRQYLKQQEIIDQWNQEIVDLLAMWI
jgi:hypothetical protein